MIKVVKPSADTTARGMLTAYEAADRMLTDMLCRPDTLKPTCKRGCTHCCKMAVVVVLGEARVIAHKLHKLPEWEQWLPRLRAASEPYLGPTLDRDKFFRSEGNACAFLDEDSGDCQIYDIRPSACRLHLSIDPPENCSPAFAGKVRYLNTLKMQQTIWQLACQLTPHWPPSAVPLPLGVLYCMMDHRPERTAAVLQHFIGLPDPFRWSDEHMKEGAVDTTPEEIANLQKAMKK